MNVVQQINIELKHPHRDDSILIECTSKSGNAWIDPDTGIVHMSLEFLDGHYLADTIRVGCMQLMQE